MAPQAPGAVPTEAAEPTQAVGATQAPVGGNVDICSLLSPADLDAAFGETYGEGTVDSAGQCLWNLEGETGNTGNVVVAYINPEQFSTLQGLLGIQEGSVELSVGGHSAFYNPTQGLTSLWVDIGEAGTFVLSFPQSDDLDPSYQDIAVQLAETALGNM